MAADCGIGRVAGGGGGARFQNVQVLCAGCRDCKPSAPPQDSVDLGEAGLGRLEVRQNMKQEGRRQSLRSERAGEPHRLVLPAEAGSGQPRSWACRSPRLEARGEMRIALRHQSHNRYREGLNRMVGRADAAGHRSPERNVPSSTNARRDRSSSPVPRAAYYGPRAAGLPKSSSVWSIPAAPFSSNMPRRISPSVEIYFVYSRTSACDAAGAPSCFSPLATIFNAPSANRR